MEVPYLLAADYANMERSGKLNVLGIFNGVAADQFPTVHRTIYLVMRLMATHGEFEIEHDILILFVDEDGNHLLELPGTFKLTKPHSGGKVYADLYSPGK